MKKKEINALAKKIAKFEYIIQTSNDPKAKSEAEKKINELCGPSHVKSWEDIEAIDEAVQEILAKELNKNS